MESSNASVCAPPRNPGFENTAPLENVVTGQRPGSYGSVPSGSPDIERLTQERERSQSATIETQDAVLKRLKAWHLWDTDRYESLSKFLMSKAGFPKRPVCPTPDQLFSLATYFFPPRQSFKVVVCDFGEGRFDRFEVDLEGVQQCKSVLRFQYDSLGLGCYIRLGAQTNVRDCSVDVCCTISNVLEVTDVRRHILVGSGKLGTVRHYFISPTHH